MIELMNFNGNPNVGLFGYCTDEFCLVGTEVKKKDCKLMEKVLQVPVHRVRIAGTSLLGVFIAGNSRGVLVPKITFEEELQALDELSIEYKVIDTKLTALGNNILINDNGAVVSTDFEKSVTKKMAEFLGVEVEKGTISNLNNVGSLASVQNKKCLVSRWINEKEKQQIEKTLNAECTPGTMGMALPYIKSAILLNKNGMIVSPQSTGIEISDAEEALGLR